MAQRCTGADAHPAVLMEAVSRLGGLTKARPLQVLSFAEALLSELNENVETNGCVSSSTRNSGSTRV